MAMHWSIIAVAGFGQKDELMAGEPIDRLRVFPVTQRRRTPVIRDIPGVVREQLRSSQRWAGLRPGARIALAVGSRGINHLQEYVRAAAHTLRELGFDPFVVAAMGSHGGATSEGQRALLAHYGIDESSLGIPVLTDMAAQLIGTNRSGIAVYWDQNALAADGVVAIGRIKPHTDFRGRYESGIAKMVVIGLGKREGALVHHAHGAPGLRNFIPQSAEVVLEKTRFLLGLAIVENADDEPGLIRIVDRDEVLSVEPGLLELAWEWMARLPFEQLDLLVIGECGKNYSGTGMDTNVLGRLLLEGELDPLRPKITRICLLDLSPETEGNATGIGLADLVTSRLVGRIDKEKSDMNCLTSCCLLRSKIPIALSTDRACIAMGMQTCWQPELDRLRMALIPNTLELNRLWATAAAVEPLQGRKEVECGTTPRGLPFDAEGWLRQEELFPQSTRGVAQMR
jgi:hypothetical protein